mgnify:CR=1 FL=1
MTPFSNPETAALAKLLTEARTIAVVGYSPRDDRPSHRIAVALQRAGYRVIPVRPGISEGLGERAYARVQDVPDAVDIVDVFRAAEFAPAVVEDCIARKVPAVWFQDGIFHEEAAQRARGAGLTVIMDRCIWRDFRHLGIRLAR